MVRKIPSIKGSGQRRPDSFKEVALGVAMPTGRNELRRVLAAGDRPRCTILAQESSIMTGNELANMYEFSYAAIKAQADKYVLGL